MPPSVSTGDRDTAVGLGQLRWCEGMKADTELLSTSTAAATCIYSRSLGHGLLYQSINSLMAEMSVRTSRQDKINNITS